MCTLFCSNSISSLKCKTATAPEIKHTCSGSRGFYKTIRHRLLHGINIVRFQSWDRFGHFITRRPSLASPSDHFVNPPPSPSRKDVKAPKAFSTGINTHMYESHNETFLRTMENSSSNYFRHRHFALSGFNSTLAPILAPAQAPKNKAGTSGSDTLDCNFILCTK